MKKLIIALILIFPVLLQASDIVIENISLDRTQGKVSFTLSWKNGWKNRKNHDAAWVFVKFVEPDRNYAHGRLSPSPILAVTA